MEITKKTYQIDAEAGKMGVYEARPKDDKPHPAVIVFQEAFGVNDHIKKVTDRVAEAGYVAVSPELFYRSQDKIVPYTDLQKAIGVMMTLKDETTKEDVAAVIKHLKGDPKVKSDKIGVVGFCMGGRLSFLTAAWFPQDIKAASVYYGGGIAGQQMAPGAKEPLELADKIQAPILGAFGETDFMIPVALVEKIKETLTKHNKTHDITIYKGAGHGFNCDDREGYNDQAAKEAWSRTTQFFSKHLQ